ncbi:MAG: NB-ARC domain-containing protein [Oscillatoriaceae cyanobacterium Prado104]|jgi:hypothetical protein|nr:NB-ARC domain-containing protein [Oscillatoriaceae cyanobacterium Prado104]
MDIQEAFKWTDEKILAKTGKHLDSLQKSILEGVWQHQDYEEIAENNQRSYDHVKKEAWKLWKLLSDALGEDVKKSNVCSLLEKEGLANFANVGVGECVQIGNINLCGDNKRSPFPNSPQNKDRSPIINLTDAPELTSFYNRTSELTTLKQWILEAQTRLITIYGLSEIGKSSIALKLIEQIQTQFDCIIWQSLANTPTLSTLQTQLKQFFSRSQPTPLPTILDYFRSSRCLVILDDLHNIFSSGQLAGEYLAEYKDYSKFFKQIATSSHQSCLILLSWEKPREIATLEGENRSTRTLHLKGLGEQSEEIFKEQGLTDEEKWSELIALYQGHPSWLNIMASIILELFDGKVARFLAEGNDLYLGDIEPLLESQLERLSESEKKVSHWLASQDDPVDISQAPADSELSRSHLWQAIQSLARRALVEKMQIEGRSFFFLNPAFKAYLQCKLNLI